MATEDCGEAEGGGGITHQEIMASCGCDWDFVVENESDKRIL